MEIIFSQYKVSEAQLERDKIEFERMANLMKSEATSKSDYDNAKTKLDISRAQLEEIKARLERATILAPISGVLNKISVEEGEYIQTGTAVAEIVDNDGKGRCDVPERHFSRRATG
jgi:multidrug efflux system membrane fusion protein